MLCCLAPGSNVSRLWGVVQTPSSLPKLGDRDISSDELMILSGVYLEVLSVNHCPVLGDLAARVFREDHVDLLLLADRFVVFFFSSLLLVTTDHWVSLWAKNDKRESLSTADQYPGRSFFLRESAATRRLVKFPLIVCSSTCVFCVQCLK